MYHNLSDFYCSKDWEDFRRVVIAERTKEDGYIYDEYTGKPIVKPYDLILHHITELTEENVHDVAVALNPANIMIVSHKSHNLIHHKLDYKCREVYLVYGSPCAGKTTWVRDAMCEGDLIVDMDDIWQCISAQDRYIKPNNLKAIAFKIRDTLIDAIKYRLGYWRCAYLIGGYPIASERDMLCKQLGAKQVFIDTPKDECLARVKGTGRDEKMWAKFIDEWFDRYQRATSIPPLS